MMDWNEVLTIALVATSSVILLAAAIAWRTMIRENPGLPFWHFLRREGTLPDDATTSVNAKALNYAVLACTLCGSRQECRAQLSTGSIAVPPANCPNRRLFREFGLWVGRPRE